MYSCWDCDIAFNDNNCPLCAEKEKCSVVKAELKRLLFLENGKDSDLSIAKKEIQIDVVNQTLSHFERHANRIENKHKKEGIFHCIEELQKIETRLQAEICEKEGE